MNEQSEITRSLLQAVKKISKASFNSGLGEHSINFNVNIGIKTVSMHVIKNEEHVNCFNEHFGPSSHWQSTFPESMADIKRFECDVARGLEDIFEFIGINE